ncbi:hypothetical protein I3843_15G096500 [Carya illinoinensis]|nr:hypothetical protein I3843_15G096500 [Carya illinoinensis]
MAKVCLVSLSLFLARFTLGPLLPLPTLCQLPHWLCSCSLAIPDHFALPESNSRYGHHAVPGLMRIVVPLQPNDD